MLTWHNLINELKTFPGGTELNVNQNSDITKFVFGSRLTQNFIG